MPPRKFILEECSVLFYLHDITRWDPLTWPINNTCSDVWRRQWHPTPVLLPGKSYGQRSPVHGVAKSRTRMSDFTFTFHFHALEKEMATHSSVLAWRIPGMAEPGGLPSMGLHRVRHDWSDLAAAATALMLAIDFSLRIIQTQSEWQAKSQSKKN